MSLRAAFTFAWFLGPTPAVGTAVHAGLTVGSRARRQPLRHPLRFRRHSLKLWLIDGGYHTLPFTLYGLVLGLWH